MDVIINMDRQTGQCSQQYVDFPTSSWTSDRDILLQPGGRWTVLADYGEVNQATSSALSGFVQRGLARFPPSPTRKYMMIIWDHGSAFQGAGEDVTCTASTSISGDDAPRMCGWLNIDTIRTGG